MTLDSANLKLIADTIRVLSAEGVEAANSGHPGMPMGSADMAAVLWSEFLKFNPEEPNWAGRDRFILSPGHGSMLLYSLLNLYGYDVSIEDLKNFRQWESKTPGHPEFGMTVGVENTTGPLGQGFSNGVGFALSQKMLAAKYSKEVFDYKVFGIVSDGDLMEGVSAEAASLAGHWKLDNIVYLYDDNQISIAGSTELSFSENIPKRFEASGWYVQSCDGHDHEEIKACLDKAVAETGRPSIICCRTVIGKGSPAKAGTSGVHGAPLGTEELAKTREALGMKGGAFTVSAEVSGLCKQAGEKGKASYGEWKKSYDTWLATSEAEEWKLQSTKELPAALKENLIKEAKAAGAGATRALSGKMLQVLAKHLPGLIGGSADLAPSTKTYINGGGDISTENFTAKNIRYGVREHAMGAITNGLAYTGEWIPHCSTFLVFSDYMRSTLRVAAISRIQSLFIFTHDSFYVGEDGPTHQPIEHVASLRAIPNLHVFRPADALETAMSYYAALELKKAPSAFMFTRQNLPVIEQSADFKPEDIMKGAYIVSGDEGAEFTIVATGSEVSKAVESASILAEKGVKARVVSMPCMELFLKQDSAYQEKVIPVAMKTVAIEAGIAQGWYRFTGKDGLVISRDEFGMSAPAEVLEEHFGFSAEAITAQISGWLK